MKTTWDEKFLGMAQRDDQTVTWLPKAYLDYLVMVGDTYFVNL